MKTEYWALLISILALISSVSLPIWFRRQDTREKIANKHSFLLQKVLSAKSLAYISRFQLIYLIQRHGDKMQAGQLGALKSQVNKIEKYEYELWHLYEECNDYEGGSTLLELEKILSNVSVTESEVSDMAKLIEDGAKSYER